MHFAFLGYLILIFAGFILGLLKYKGNPLRPLIILLGVTFVSEAVGLILAYRIRTNYPVYHVLSPLQSMCWGAFLWAHASTAKARFFIWVVFGTLVSFSLANTIFIQSLFKFPDNILRLQSFVLMSYGFWLFFLKIDAPSQINVFKDPVFVTAVGLIWFNLLMFVFFNFHDYLINDLLSRQTFRIINYITNYVYYSIMLLAVIFSLGQRLKI